MMNNTWQLQDDPANYDDEGNYDGEVCQSQRKIKEARDAAEEVRYQRAIDKLCKDRSQEVKE